MSPGFTLLNLRGAGGEGGFSMGSINRFYFAWKVILGIWGCLKVLVNLVCPCFQDIDHHPVCLRERIGPKEPAKEVWGVVSPAVNWALYHSTHGGG